MSQDTNRQVPAKRETPCRFVKSRCNDFEVDRFKLADLALLLLKFLHAFRASEIYEIGNFESEIKRINQHGRWYSVI